MGRLPWHTIRPSSYGTMFVMPNYQQSQQHSMHKMPKDASIYCHRSGSRERSWDRGGRGKKEKRGCSPHTIWRTPLLYCIPCMAVSRMLSVPADSRDNLLHRNLLSISD